MSEFFATVGSRLAEGYDQPLVPIAINPVPVPQISNISLSTNIIMKKLDSLKSGKSAGRDNISWKLLKFAGPTIASPLDGLYTRSLNECRVFNRWKLARLSPIFKKDDELEIGDYRPISLLSIPSKILDSCVSDTVVSHVFGENDCLVTDHQWEFRKGYSTELLLIHITETWRHALNADRVVGAVFVDFQKPLTAYPTQP